ncbi:hypothetical protein DXF96_14035 [Heyndrickxia coagulans]|nr:hypothetical protein CIW84_09645 [Heyndrickxia coagulans]KGT38303.1 hypothetical protein P421_10720 [Heyndrickxia coagulans P38]AVD56118.1 hypothetical protein C3766_08230 [Heyndrickxia coagulans]AWP37023.1 hypothetical protein CYJ15_08515 [Heyndrickxia coagulans]KGB28283.1 hypothetical protein IE89_17845 [Heyndrickxia coagulans]
MRFRTACRLFCPGRYVLENREAETFLQMFRSCRRFSTSMPLHRETYFVLPLDPRARGLLF